MQAAERKQALKRARAKIELGRHEVDQRMAANPSYHRPTGMAYLAAVVEAANLAPLERDELERHEQAVRLRGQRVNAVRDKSPALVRAIDEELRSIGYVITQAPERGRNEQDMRFLEEWEPEPKEAT